MKVGALFKYCIIQMMHFSLQLIISPHICWFLECYSLMCIFKACTMDRYYNIIFRKPRNFFPPAEITSNLQKY